MKIILVNLDRDTAKLRFMEEQLGRLGVRYERVAAVDGRAMPADEKRRAVNRFRWWCAIGLKPRDAEIGCALSHAAIYRGMADCESVCILEDDVVLAEGFPKAIEEIEKWIGNEVPRVVMLSDQTRMYEKVKVKGEGEVRRSSFAYCTDAYVLNRKAAEALLRENYPLQRPCDHWAKWVKRGAIELYHCLPTMARQDQVTFVSSTQGGILQVKDYSPLKWAWHKGCRVVGKVLDRILG